MPFTLAHPAATLPLRRWLGPLAVWPALVIGSMTPDLPYFLPMHAFEGRTHAPFAVIWFDLPAGFAMYLAWEHLLREPSVFLLPRDVRRRLAARLPARHASLAPVVACLVLGALTHIAWDACTHREGLLVQAWPPMRHLLWNAWGYRVRVYKLLQHGSTIGGGAVLGVWAWRKLRALPAAAADPPAPFSARARHTVWALMAVAGAAAGVFALRAAFPIDSIRALERFAGPASVSGILAVVVPLILFGVAWRARVRVRA